MAFGLALDRLDAKWCILHATGAPKGMAKVGHAPRIWATKP
jgi:hypothetical protein